MIKISYHNHYALSTKTQSTYRVEIIDYIYTIGRKHNLPITSIKHHAFEIWIEFANPVHETWFLLTFNQPYEVKQLC